MLRLNYQVLLTVFGFSLAIQVELSSAARLSNDLTLTEGMRVPHQDLLLRMEAYSIVPGRIITITAGTCRATKSIVCKALTVELKTAALPAVAGLLNLRLLRLAEGLM